jgi:putative PEP-CTERM system TPR-repeat lipoprotein
MKKSITLTGIARAVGLSTLLLTLTACGWGDTAEEHVAKANQYIAQADFKSAIIELKNALTLDSQSAEARYLLGTVYLESGDMPSAQKELQRALELGWPSEDIRPGLAQSLSAQGEYEQVRDISSRGLSPAAEATLLAHKAQAALALGDSWDAEELIEKALAKSPDSVDALLARTRIQASQNDLEGAEKTLEQVISLAPGQNRAWSLRGDILASRQDFTGAREAYDQAVLLDPNNYNDLFKRATLNLQLGAFDRAQDDTTALLAKAPQHPGPNYLQGLLHYQAGNYAEAITALSVTESAFQQFPLSLYFLASAQLIEGNIDQAAGLAGRFHKLLPDNIQGRKLLAAIRLQQGKYSVVQALLQPVLDSNPDDLEALNLTANALLQDGNTHEGIELLSRVAALQPDSPVAQLRLGAGLLISGEGSAATQRMETALELNPEFQQADVLLVLNYLQQKDFPAAIDAAKAYQRRNLTSVTPHNLLGKVYLEAGQPDDARAAFQRALELDSVDIAANHSLAEMAVSDNDLAAARVYYETVLAEHEDSMFTLIQLAMLDAREGDETAMLGHLERAAEVAPSALQPRVLLARFYLGKGRPEQVAPLFTNLEEQQQQAPEVLRLMALAQLSSKDAGAAQFTLEQLLESTPDNAEIRHMMAMAAAGSGDNTRAREELARAIALDEAYVPSRIALARIALATGAAPEFEQHLDKLVALAPENPDVLSLQAAAARGRGDTDTALGFVEKAFALAPSSGTLVTLASYQQAAGDRAGAMKRYTAWLDEHPEDLPVRMAYANALQLDGIFDDAGSQYAVVLKEDPDNVIALNNQAWILREQNPTQALEYARKAADLAPDSAEVLDTLAVVEYLNKDYARARRSIGRALKASPDHPSMLYHSAMIDVALEDTPGARATLEELLSRDATFPEAADAEALLASLSQ